MSIKDIIKFYEDEKNIYTSEDIDEYCSTTLTKDNETGEDTRPNKNLKAKPKSSTAKTDGLKRSTRKKIMSQ